LIRHVVIFDLLAFSGFEKTESLKSLQADESKYDAKKKTNLPIPTQTGILIDLLLISNLP